MKKSSSERATAGSFKTPSAGASMAAAGQALHAREAGKSAKVAALVFVFFALSLVVFMGTMAGDSAVASEPAPPEIAPHVAKPEGVEAAKPEGVEVAKPEGVEAAKPEGVEVAKPEGAAALPVVPVGALGDLEALASTASTGPNASGVDSAAQMRAMYDGLLDQALSELDYWRQQAGGGASSVGASGALPPLGALTLSSPGASAARDAGTPPVVTAVLPPTSLASGQLAPIDGAATPDVEGLAGSLSTSMLATPGRPRIEQVAATVKSMKPADAALVIAGWDEVLAADVLSRLKAKPAGAIAAAMSPDLAARLLARVSTLRLATMDEP